MAKVAAKKAVAKANMQPFTIAGHTVAPGDRSHFDLPAAQLYTHTPLEMPLEIIHGKRPGPVLLVSAAIHGDELNGVEIIRRLRMLKILERLRGTLMLVPIVNLFGFINKTRYLPDRRDLNRCFPGVEKGSLASRFANLFFNEIARHSTHIIDLHTGAVHRDNLPQIRAALDNPEIEAMARAFGLPVIINAGQIEGSLRCEAGKVGIPVLTYESGEALRLDEKCIVAGVRGIVNVMRTIEMLPQRKKTTRSSVLKEPFVALSTRWFRANADGLFRPMAKLGSHINKGDTIGVISAPVGQVETLLQSTRQGIIVGMNNMPLVNEGEALINVATFDESSLVEGEISAQQEALERDPLFELTEIEEPEA